MSIIGLDLSLTGTGIVALDNSGELLKSHTVSPRKLIGMERLDFIRREVSEFISSIPTYPTFLALENYAFASKGDTTKLAELGGIIKLTLFRNNIPFIKAAPIQVKKFATGDGRSEKDQVMLQVFKRWGFEASDNNQADAFVLAKIAQFIEMKLRGTSFQDEVIQAIMSPSKKKKGGKNV